MTAEIDTNLKISAVTRVSPSRYAYLRSCALYEACRSAGQQPLLPTSPLAQIGGIAHRLLERAARGEFSEPGAVERAWDEMVDRAESRMKASPLDCRFVPLRETVRQYEVVRIQAFRKAEWIALNVAGASGVSGGTPKYAKKFEVWLQSPDGGVGGYVDYLEETPDGTIIRDYKTGAVMETAELETTAGIKPAYVVQLQLYAALYWSTHDRWPKRLELVPLLGPAVIVAFEPSECLELLNQAKQTLLAINFQIQTILIRNGRIAQLATPSADACKFCEFRPGCEAYRERRPEIAATQWPMDVSGRVMQQKTFAIGTTTVEISSADEKERYRITGLRAAKYPTLATNQVGAFMSAYNLRRESAPATFSDTLLTAVYFSSDVPADFGQAKRAYI